MFETRQITSVSTGTTVISMAVNPPFSGNLLLQASGWVGLALPATISGAGCQPFLDGSPIGTGGEASVNGSLTVEAMAVTGASAISAGNHTVTVVCSTSIGGTTPTVSLDAFAVVTGT